MPVHPCVERSRDDDNENLLPRLEVGLIEAEHTYEKYGNTQIVSNRCVSAQRLI